MGEEDEMRRKVLPKECRNIYISERPCNERALILLDYLCPKRFPARSSKKRVQFFIRADKKILIRGEFRDVSKYFEFKKYDGERKKR